MSIEFIGVCFVAFVLFSGMFFIYIYSKIVDSLSGW